MHYEVQMARRKKIKGNLTDFVFEGAEIQLSFPRVAVNILSNSAILGVAGIPSKHMEFTPPALTHTLKIIIKIGIHQKISNLFVLEFSKAHKL